MRKLPLILILASAILTARAISQEIVIEPTNGRAQSTNRVKRPAAMESTPAQVTKPPVEERSSPKKPAKAVSTKKKIVPQLKQVSVETRTVTEPKAEETKNESGEAIPAPRKVIPARPGWAMNDTRDAHSLQAEIAVALARDPKLVDSSIKVSVEDGLVTLEGRAAGTEERLQAERLTQSYAWNRKLVDHIEIVGGVSAQK
jgi:hypothetical protein